MGLSVFETNSTASAAVTGIYQTLVTNSIGGGTRGISALLGLSSDEFSLYPSSDLLLNQTYSNELTAEDAPPIWSQLYNCIYQANLAIEGLKSTQGVTADLKNQLLGEAKFIRAFCNFYLVNIYGNIPLITSSNYKINKISKRVSEIEVYQQITSDLTEAQSLLSEDFLAPDQTITTARVRPNKSAAIALLARVQLYQKNWAEAELLASNLINSENYQLSENLNDVFLPNNMEAIWQLEPPFNGFNAPDGALLNGFLSYGEPSSFDPFLLNKFLLDDFEPGDLRKVNWTVTSTNSIDSFYYPFKYKLNYTGVLPGEYPVILRLAEQYLIRAEARAHQDNLAEANEDLNMIRNRAGLADIASLSKQDLLNSIYKERRIEFFTENGHRWLDLKRTGKADATMAVVAPQKSGTWESKDKLYPIPLSDITTNPNLKQNEGY